MVINNRARKLLAHDVVTESTLGSTLVVNSSASALVVNCSVLVVVVGLGVGA